MPGVGFQGFGILLRALQRFLQQDWRRAHVEPARRRHVHAQRVSRQMSLMPGRKVNGGRQRRVQFCAAAQEGDDRLEIHARSPFETGLRADPVASILPASVCLGLDFHQVAPNPSVHTHLT